MTIDNPQQARPALGIATIHQELNTVPAMTVAENLSLGVEPRTKNTERWTDGGCAQTRWRSWVRLGCTVDPSAELGSLP